MRNFSLFVLLTALLATGIVACEKEKVSIPPAVAEFTAASKTASYYVLDDPKSTYKIPVGISVASNVDRTINFTVTSPTGAAAGTQYTIASNSITIPAGKVVDSIEVKGLFAGYPTGRKDTLVFTITGGDVPASSWGSKFNLVVQKYCPVDLNDFLGSYTQSSNSATGAKYTITVESVATTGPTTGYMIIKGLYNGSQTPVRVELDWTNPANFTTTVQTTQNLYVHPTYGPLGVKAAGKGSFSSCANTFTLTYTRFVDAGEFAANTTTMAR